MRAGQAGSAPGVGRLGRSSNSPEFTSHAQGQARIKLTGARNLSIKSSCIVDLAPASLLPQIRTPLKKIQAASSGWMAELTLRSGTDNNLVHINIVRLLDRERNSARDRLRRHGELVPGLFELGFHLRICHSFREVRVDEAR